MWQKSREELIVTQWDVNILACCAYFLSWLELIVTQWDVNCFTPKEDNVLLMELIVTQWDVNINGNEQACGVVLN